MQSTVFWIKKVNVFFLQNTNNIVYFYQTSFSVRILQEKGFPVSLAIKLRKERHFVQRKKRQRGVGQCLWQWDHQYQVRKPQPCLPNHYSFRMSQGEWCRLCWFILFLSKKTQYFKSVKFLLVKKMTTTSYLLEVILVSTNQKLLSWNANKNAISTFHSR